MQELAEKYGEQIFMLQSIARTAVRDVDPQVSTSSIVSLFAHVCTRVGRACAAVEKVRFLNASGVLQNDLTYFRIDTKRFEILVAPFWGEVKYGVTGAVSSFLLSQDPLTLAAAYIALRDCVVQVKEKGYTLFVLQRKPGQT